MLPFPASGLSYWFCKPKPGRSAKAAAAPLCRPCFARSTRDRGTQRDRGTCSHRPQGCPGEGGRATAARPEMHSLGSVCLHRGSLYRASTTCTGSLIKAETKKSAALGAVFCWCRVPGGSSRHPGCRNLCGHRATGSARADTAWPCSSLQTHLSRFSHHLQLFYLCSFLWLNTGGEMSYFQMHLLLFIQTLSFQRATEESVENQSTPKCF